MLAHGRVTQMEELPSLGPTPSKQRNMRQLSPPPPLPYPSPHPCVAAESSLKLSWEPIGLILLGSMLSRRELFASQDIGVDDRKHGWPA